MIKEIQELKQKILESIFGENSLYKSQYGQVSLNKVCELYKGEIVNNRNLPYLEAKVIRGVKQPKIKKSGIFIKKGTKIILVDGENSGEVMIAPIDGYMGSTFRILLANKAIDEDYLLFFIMYHKKRLKDNKTGSATPHLNKKIFNNLKIIFPPVAEQQRIVSAIEKFFALIDGIRDDYNTIQSYIATLKQQILDSVFGENSSYKSYYEKCYKTSLKKLISKKNIGDGDWILSNEMDNKGDYNLIQLKHIGKGIFNYKPFNHINSNIFTRNKCSEIKEDYLLINRLVANHMDVCLLPKLTQKCITAVDVCWIAPSKEYNQKYLMYYLLSPSFQYDVKKLCSGSTRKRISKKNLINIQMTIHSIENQEKIVNFIERTFKLLDSINEV